ncbi:hypothetical protein H4R19_003534 [Coemansia spiralis]|nr:hypothetical protein H4R19_003534 [Coemansia spiralis]
MTGHTIVPSPLPRVDIPGCDLPTFWLGQMRAIEAFARAQSPRPVYLDEGDGSVQLYLGQIEAMSARLAAGLYHALGVRPGNVVAVVLPNTAYYVVITLAIHMLGATCLAANPASTERELAHQLERTATRFVIEAAAGASDAAPAPHSIAVRPMASTSARLLSSLLSDRVFPRRRLHSADEARTTPAFICFSGGTTGLPKPTVLSHYNMVANIVQVLAAQRQMVLPPGQPATTLCLLPIFHSYGLVCAAYGMPLCGAAVVVMRGFTMDRFLACIARHSVTHAPLTPPLINALSRLPPDTPAISGLRWIVSGAGPLGDNIIQRLEATLPDVQVMQAYGVTEASPGISLTTPRCRRAGASGRLLPNIDAKVIDDEGRLLGPGDTGELCFRGPNVMLGYLDQPKATREAIDSDGFLHTGDVGRIDVDGYVFVTDRKKELIKYNGFQVAPAELEALLLLHPSVRDCAVIGVFDETRQTEFPRAYLVLDTAADRDAAAQEAVAWLDERVAYYKRLRGGYVLVDEIPKSPAGKILRRLLRPATSSSSRVAD